MCTKFQKQHAICVVVFVWFHGEMCCYFIPYSLKIKNLYRDSIVSNVILPMPSRPSLPPPSLPNLPPTSLPCQILEWMMHPRAANFNSLLKLYTIMFSVVVVFAGHFSIALSPLSSRLTAFLSHMISSEWLPHFIACFEYLPKWCIYSAVWLLHGWCHVAISVHSMYTIL